MYHRLGGDAVGMSTVPRGNRGTPLRHQDIRYQHHNRPWTRRTPVEVSHEEVQIAANNAQPLMTEIMREMIKEHNIHDRYIKTRRIQTHTPTHRRLSSQNKSTLHGVATTAPCSIIPTVKCSSAPICLWKECISTSPTSTFNTSATRRRW